MNAVLLSVSVQIQSVFENISPKERRREEKKVRSSTLFVVAAAAPVRKRVSRPSRYALCIQGGSTTRKKKDTYATPTVKARLGTLVISLSKKRALATMVS